MNLAGALTQLPHGSIPENSEGMLSQQSSFTTSGHQFSGSKVMISVSSEKRMSGHYPGAIAAHEFLAMGTKSIKVVCLTTQAGMFGSGQQGLTRSVGPDFVWVGLGSERRSGLQLAVGVL